MGKEDALRAYRDSVYDAVEHHMEMRTGSRTTPIVGGIIPGLKLLGNALYRPLKVGGALAFGYDGEAERPFPQLKEMPEAFKGTSLGEAFSTSLKLKEESANARVRSMEKLLNLDISGAWQNASVASYAESKDTNVVFSEEGAMAQGNGSFVAALSAGSRDSGHSR